MTFVWKHPSKYKNTTEDQKNDKTQESENNQDKDSSNESQDPQPQE
jgi:hypothetical protein